MILDNIVALTNAGRTMTVTQTQTALLIRIEDKDGNVFERLLNPKRMLRVGDVDTLFSMELDNMYRDMHRANQIARRDHESSVPRPSAEADDALGVGNRRSQFRKNYDL